MNKLLSNINIINAIAFILALFMLITPFVYYPVLVDNGPTWLGLDDSWKMALNYALVKHWVWGKDIIYVYGPLGFFSTRIGFGISKWVFILFDLFWTFNFFMIFKHLLGEIKNKFLAVLIAVLLLLLTNTFPGPDVVWVMIIFAFFWMYQSFNTPKLYYFIILSVCVTLCLFIKLNIGLFALVFFFGHLVNVYYSKHLSVGKLVLLLCIQVCFIMITSYFLRVSLFHYFYNATQILKGHNDIMYLREEHKSMEMLLYLLFYSMLIMHLIYAVFLIKNKNYGQVFFIIINVFFLFVFKKQSTVRNDQQHLSEFLHYAPLVLMYGNLFFFKNYIQIVSLSVFLLFFIAAIFCRKGDASLFVKYRIRSVNNYCKGIKSYNDIMYFNQQKKRYIPSHILTKLGNNSVDIFPWDIEYLLENKLNYLPRPMLQSHMAYTNYLADLDYQHYVTNPPQFVIYDYDAIDGRNPFNEEPTVNAFICRNYRLVDTFTSNERWRLLLERKEQVGPLQLETINDDELPTTSHIPVGGADYLKIYLTYNAPGKLKSAWGKVPFIIISYITTDGSKYEYKTSPQMLKTGIFTTKLVTKTQDFAQLINGPSNSLQNIQFIQLNIDTSYFTDKIKIIRYRVK